MKKIVILVTFVMAWSLSSESAILEKSKIRTYSISDKIFLTHIIYESYGNNYLNKITDINFLMTIIPQLKNQEYKIIKQQKIQIAKEDVFFLVCKLKYNFFSFLIFYKNDDCYYYSMQSKSMLFPETLDQLKKAFFNNKLSINSLKLTEAIEDSKCISNLDNSGENDSSKIIKNGKKVLLK